MRTSIRGSWIGPALLAALILIAVTSCPALSRVPASRARPGAPLHPLRAGLGRALDRLPPGAGEARVPSGAIARRPGRA